MASWTDFKTLVEDPLAVFEKEQPAFCDRYKNCDDRFGFKMATFARWYPVFRFCYEDYFKVHVQGIENVPTEGPGLLVGNHSGLLPLDGAMITMAMVGHHLVPRRVRYLVTDWFFTLPGVSDWIKETGQVRATLENAKELIVDNELVGIYPEGLRGVGKTLAERYRVHDFHPGFVQLAISTQTPIIPIATVGGDEIYPNFINVKTVGQLLKMPFFPTTPAFPWLPFPLNFIPLPVRWMINIHEPIKLDYPPEKAHDRKLVLKIAREIQYDIQRDLNRLLRERKSLFTGWDDAADDSES